MPGLENGAPNFGRWRSRVRGAPEVLGHVPVSCLAEEIATPGDGQIRALFTVAGNPVLSTPGGDRLDAALDGLDCMISVDNWINETTRHADVILPGLSPLEQPHHDDLIWNFAVGSGANYSPPIFPPDRRPARRVGDPDPPRRPVPRENRGEVDVAAIDDGFFDVLADTQGLDGPTLRAATTTAAPSACSTSRLRTGPFGDRYGEDPDGLNLDKVKAEPHGIDLGPMEPRLAEVLTTEAGKVRLAPSYITADLPRLAARLDRPPTSSCSISRRHLRSNNSWMHNVNVLVKGKDRCTLLVHPDDARHGVRDGCLARVTSAAGTVDVPAEITEDIRPGVVSLPHGWGHNLPGTRLAVANEHAGVNTNVLSPGTFVDVLSGNAAVNGIPITIGPVPTS